MPPTPAEKQPSKAAQITRRSFLAGGAAATASLAAYAATAGSHQLEVTHRTFAIRNLPDAFAGFRIAQLSDIHLDEFTEPSYLAHAVDLINNLNPDLVALTGDFVSRGPRPVSFARRQAGHCAEILSALRCPHRLAILGNHDVAVGAGFIINALRDRGIPTLVDSYTAVERGDSRLWICGSDDAGTRKPDLFLSIPPQTDGPVIFLCHEPDYADTVVHHPRFPLIDLMLSGHSHGGQVRLPLLGPLILPPMGKHYFDGRYQFDHMQLYVNRGLGTVGLPFRLNCPSEITELTLTRA